MNFWAMCQVGEICVEQRYHWREEEGQKAREVPITIICKDNDRGERIALLGHPGVL